jgi:hypothetical protein
VLNTERLSMMLIPFGKRTELAATTPVRSGPTLISQNGTVPH